MAIRVVLADDHALVRAGVRALLDGLDGIDVVAEADSGRAALEAVREHEPDVLLLDIAMPELNGLEVARRMADGPADVAVLMLSVHANQEYVRQALRLGASGYLLKDAGPAELRVAIEAASEGKTYLSPSVSGDVLDAYVQRTPAANDVADRLTPRQRQVLRLVAKGHTSRDIARQLEISVKTVESHRTALMKRLDIHDVASLVRYAIRSGLITADE